MNIAIDQDLASIMRSIGERARAASHRLSVASAGQKDAALAAMAREVRKDAGLIAAENAGDVAAANQKGLKSSFVDRLTLTPERVEAMARGIEEIARLPDPVGTVIAEWTRPNGIVIRRVRVPIGVIGMIYESRPNVTADAGALALKSGNAVILRGGSDGLRSSAAIVSALRRGLAAAELPEDAIQMVSTTDRAAVGMMLEGLNGTIDVIVPRGGRSLVERVQSDARIPVFSHLEGVCHVYVHASADLEMAEAILLNSKMRRTGVCGAAETALIDRGCAATHLKPLIDALIAAGCEVRGCPETAAADSRVVPATEADWPAEYLDAVIAMRVVGGIEEAMAHIARYGSQHTDAIVAEDQAAAERFLAELDSAIVLHNASTQFADGGEFGFGAEIGISTGKLHARGPVGVEQLTTFKYQIRGAGQTRP
ncbi:MAG: glutamate-5-semialdehyde dehydrogenase [Hyphomicrobiales bacterium]